MTASALSWPSEVMIADPAQIAEAYIRRIAPFPGQGGDDGILIPEPHFLLDWGLALFLAGRFEESAARFRDVIFENPYLIPFALGRRPKTLSIWHSTNLMYRDYAREYFDWHKNLWTDRPEARRFLQFIWEDPEVRSDYWIWVDLWERASDLEVGRERNAVLEQIYRVEGRRLSPRFFARLKEHTAAYHETPKGRVS